jgi:glutathione S-transferase
MSGCILHHYDGSPFAHKIRLIFGLKRIAWRSVIIPMIMPKPDLVALTGGYRKTPVLQIGADVFCDTQLIARELERRFPQPTLFPWGGEGIATMLSGWADRVLFLPAVNFALSQIADKLPPGFLEDRAKMMGRPPADPEKLKAAGPRLRNEMWLHFHHLASALADGRPFLLGGKPGLADFAVCHSIWMVSQSGRRAASALEPFPSITAWLTRLAELGTGTREETDSQQALAVASEAAPEPARAATAADDFLKPGMRVSVQSDDRVPEPVSGEIVFADIYEVAIRRNAPEVGEVVVHFPRVGFSVRAL